MLCTTEYLLLYSYYLCLLTQNNENKNCMKQLCLGLTTINRTFTNFKYNT